VDHLRAGALLAAPDNEPAKNAAEYEGACRQAIEGLETHLKAGGAKTFDARMQVILARLPSPPVKPKYQRKRAPPTSTKIFFSRLDADVQAALADRRIIEVMFEWFGSRTMAIILSGLLSKEPLERQGAPKTRTLAMMNELIHDIARTVQLEGPADSAAEIVRRLQRLFPAKWGEPTYKANNLERMIRGTGRATDWD
jgi:hypothetical protein